MFVIMYACMHALAVSLVTCIFDHEHGAAHVYAKEVALMVSLDGVSLKRTGTQTISAPIKSKSWLKIRGGICRRTSSGFRLIRSPGRLLGFHGPGSPGQKGCIMDLLCDSRQLLDVCNEAHYSFHMFSVWRGPPLKPNN